VKVRPDPTGAGARYQRGFALIAVLALAAMISAYLIAAALNPTGSELIREREQRSMSALRQAKEALIAYAASEVVQSGYFQPGALPCPDQNNDGTADCFGSTAASMIGRLPHVTMGIEDLRDASGERLWYALSHDFRKLQCPTANCTVINSDTRGQLTIVGDAPAAQVVAIVFAPGEAVQGQQRDPANANTVTNYLEGADLTSPVNFTFTSITLPSNVANDRLIPITQVDLMTAVEPIVAARLERDIKPHVAAYFTGWGSMGYPFPAPFPAGVGSPDPGPGRAQSEYKGDTTMTNGLMPLTREAGWVAWLTSSVTVSNIPGAGTGDTSFSWTCSASTSALVSCRIDYNTGSSDRPAIQLRATLRRAGRSFVKPVVQGDKVMTDKNGTPIDWSGSSPLFSPTVTNTLQSSGDGTVTFRGRLRNGNSTEGRVFIQVPVPGYAAISDSADATAGWFIANEWFRQTYYAVARDYLPSGIGCCITASNLPPGYAPANNKRAILVLSGRQINGTPPRPSANLGDYFEGVNATPPPNFAFLHRVGPIGLTAAGGVPINDKVVVLAP